MSSVQEAGRTAAKGEVSLVALTKRFGQVAAVDAIDLRIPSGGFYSLLGPSGCGKTTTLRMIGGFEQPTSGQVLLDGRDMAGTPPSKRPVNTVFQSYALFPHLRVFDNVAFGLRRRRIERSEVQRRVGEALELVQLTSLSRRKPAQLSGGQQQRVALARALVVQPAVLLLDEPLGALDAKLRRELQVELKQLQAEVGITFAYVTHDQEEALTMSDQIAVLNCGRVEQAASPRELYEEPANAFVANFLGVSNLMDGFVVGPSGEGVEIRLAEGIVMQARRGDLNARGETDVVIRPERIQIEPAGSGGPNRVAAIVTNVVYLGSELQLTAHLAFGRTITALVANDDDDKASTWIPGTSVTCHLPPTGLRVLGKASTATPEVPGADEGASLSGRVSGGS